jgi:dihydroorotate dehydrogenase electron transfer subunit
MGLKNFSVKSVERNGDYAVITIKGDFKPSLPGQFYMLRGDWGMDPLLARPISVMDETSRTGLLRFLIKAVGRGTRLLIDMKPGEKIFALGPLGNPFPEPDEGSIPVLVGGGVGVPPLYHLACELLKKGLKPRFREGARSSTDLLLLEEFRAHGIEPVITTEDGTEGGRGLATDPLGEILRELYGGVTVYACGPEGMLKAVASLCSGVECHLSLEARMGCGYGVCLGCVVPVLRDGRRKYLRVCAEGPVFRAEEVLWE